VWSGGVNVSGRIGAAGIYPGAQDGQTLEESLVAERILVPLDGSALAERAIPLAVDLARRTAGKVRLVRVHVPVVPLAPPNDLGPLYYDPAWDAQARDAEQRYLDGVVGRLRGSAGVPNDALLLDGAEIAPVIEHAAADYGATLIVMTTHGHGGAALAWLGSIASGVVRAADRPVLVVPESAEKGLPNVRRVLIGHDGTATSDAVLESAGSLARTCGAAVSLVRVVPPPLVGDVWTALSGEGLDRFGVDRSAERAKEQLDRVAQQFRELGLTVDTVVIVNANPARALIDEIARTDADLVALSTAGRGLSRLIIGSVADKVLRACARPTLIRRPPQAPATA
jgi:nucleotide-binding universal stress UspA family protein